MHTAKNMKRFGMLLFLWLIMAVGFASAAWAKEGFLNTSDGVKLFYDYNKVEGEKGTALLLHGWGMSYNEWSEFSKFLNKNGWSTMAIDFRGHGASTDQGKRQLDYQDFKGNDSRKMLLDVKAAADFIRYSHKIFIVGSSFGAAVAFTYGTEHHDIRGVVLLSPSLQYPEAAYAGEMRKYGNRPIFLAASEGDRICYQAATELNAKAQGRPKFMKYKGSVHASGLLGTDKNLKFEILKWMNL